ncbi:MAG TPA: hypothetical protein VJS15_06195 [Allosphingosinicella sp.]|nr:hypothetical protein [Allosphingosinicella sp.]
MKRVLFAAVAGLGLVSASPPEGDHRIEARAGYPPCSATVTDECIQLYERGVRAPANLARNHRREARPTQAAHAGGGRHYPPCTATRKDECRQQRALARRVRMAGERG